MCVYACVCVSGEGESTNITQGKFVGNLHADLLPQLGLSYLQTNYFTLWNSICLLKNKDKQGGYSA